MTDRDYFHIIDTREPKCHIVVIDVYRGYRIGIEKLYNGKWTILDLLTGDGAVIKIASKNNTFCVLQKDKLDVYIAAFDFVELSLVNSVKVDGEHVKKMIIKDKNVFLLSTNGIVKQIDIHNSITTEVSNNIKDIGYDNYNKILILTVCGQLQELDTCANIRQYIAIFDVDTLVNTPLGLFYLSKGYLCKYSDSGATMVVSNKRITSIVADDKCSDIFHVTYEDKTTKDIKIEKKQIEAYTLTPI